MAVDKKVKKKKTTAADLPWEVIRKEILTRLPIKSVVRFKSVSTSWLSLFSDPQFVKEHHSAPQNASDYDFLVVQKSSSIFILSRYKETFALPLDKYRLIGSINGLVCLSNGEKFSLWNPAIHQYKKFTLASHHYRVLNHIGFGFDPVSNVYKIVVLSMDKRSAIVYCSKSDSWIDICVPAKVFPKSRHNDSYGPAVIAKDCPYWTFAKFLRGKHPSNRMEEVLTAIFLIVKFNVASNEFKLMPGLQIIKSSPGMGVDFCSRVVDLKDCLSLIMYQGNSSNCMVDIYSLDGEDGCCGWVKMYNLGPLDFRTRSMHVSPIQGFKYDDEIVFYDDNGKFSCYDHKAHKIKRLVGTSFANSSVMRCFRYMPSLVFLEGMKSVYLTTQSRTRGLCYRTPRQLINSLKN